MGSRTDRESGSVLALGALGIVFGDIGTSPLYAFRAVLGTSSHLDTNTVYGLTSTVVWSMAIVVAALYVGTLTAMDHDGEGGLLALLTLVRRQSSGGVLAAATIVGMLGAALFLGDSLVTPAISVLSASEGIEVVNPSLDQLALPGAVVILIGVFLLQHVGSGRIGRVYGPVMLLWFLTLGITGTASIAYDPGALTTLSPTWALRYFIDQPLTAFLALGAVVLTVTGAEALYADLGHFDRKAIARSWFGLVFPALLLAYVGEAAAVVRHRGSAGQPFYAVVPHWATIAVLVLATLATVIASEATIAGAFTVLHQAGGLGLFPRLLTRHPSKLGGARVYLPAANWTLGVAVLGVVLTFGSSSSLASAYGVAVSGTVLTTVILAVLLTALRGERTRLVVTLMLGLAAVLFAAATSPKITSGGWLPLCAAAIVFTTMATWRAGRRRLRAQRLDLEQPTTDLVERLRHGLNRRPGSAVFLTDDRDTTPLALDFVIDHEGGLADHVIVLSWHVEDSPRSAAHDEAMDARQLAEGVVAIDIALGYRDRLDPQRLLRRAAVVSPALLAGFDADQAVYYISQELPRVARHGGLPRWQQRLFVAIDRLTSDRVATLTLPRDRTIVFGRELDL
jgi:KUP system potassium uptake protein